MLCGDRQQWKNGQEADGGQVGKVSRGEGIHPCGCRHRIANAKATETCGAGKGFRLVHDLRAASFRYRRTLGRLVWKHDPNLTRMRSEQMSASAKVSENHGTF